MGPWKLILIALALLSMAFRPNVMGSGPLVSAGDGGGASACTDGVDCPCDDTPAGGTNIAGDTVLYCSDWQETAWRDPGDANSPWRPGATPNYFRGGNSTNIQTVTMGQASQAAAWVHNDGPSNAWCEAPQQPWECCTGAGTGPCPVYGSACDVPGFPSCGGNIWATDDLGNVDIYNVPRNPIYGSTDVSLRPTLQTHYGFAGIVQENEVTLLTDGDATEPTTPPGNLRQFLVQHVPRGTTDNAEHRDVMGHTDGASWGSQQHVSRTQIFAYLDSVGSSGVFNYAFKHNEWNPGSDFWDMGGLPFGTWGPGVGGSWSQSHTDAAPFSARLFASCAAFTSDPLFSAGPEIEWGCNLDDNFDWRVKPSVYQRSTDLPFGEFGCIESEWDATDATLVTMRVHFTPLGGTRTKIMEVTGPWASTDNGRTRTGIQYNHYANANGDSGTALSLATGRALGGVIDIQGPPSTCAEAAGIPWP